MNRSTHLSAYALDRLVAGTPGDREQRHLAACDACRARLDAHRETLQAIAHTPEFARQRGRVLAAAAAAAPRPRPRPRPRRRSHLLAAVLALAAALAVVVWPDRGSGPAGLTPPDTLRPKGGFVLSVVRPADGQVDGVFPAGAEVELRVGGWEAAALVLALDVEGRASVVWPAGAARSGRIASDGRLSPRFQVTPGDLLLLSLFSNTPIDAETARRAFEEAAAACAGPPEPACSAPPHQAGEIGRAWSRLRVGEGDR